MGGFNMQLDAGFWGVLCLMNMLICKEKMGYKLHLNTS